MITMIAEILSNEFELELLSYDEYTSSEAGTLSSYFLRVRRPLCKISRLSSLRSKI